MSDDSVFLHHEPCPSCGSSDGCSVYSDGHRYCFVCEEYFPGDGEEHSHGNRKSQRMADLIDRGDVTALTKRGITEETCQLFGYTLSRMGGEPVQVAHYKNADGDVVAQHVRTKEKDFPWLGSKKDALLFGQWLWRDGGKMVVVTEGEIDCMTVSQLQGNKWPVVSIKSGANGAKKDFAEHLEWLNRFESVVIMFDMDEPGQKAANECALMLAPGKAKIASLPLKDANDMLKSGRGGEVINAIWNAKTYRPDGVVSGEEIWDRIANSPEVVCYPYPDFMSEMNTKTYGIRLGELEVWTSGTGMGKTTVIKQLQHHFHQTTPLNQAIIHLEEPLEDTAEGLIGMHLGKRINLPDVKAELDPAEFRAAFEELFLKTDAEGNPRIQLYDAFGSLESDTLYNKIRFFAKGLGCQVIWIDHLNILVSDLGTDGDERRIIDAIMHHLKELTVELGVYIGLIVHLKKAPQGKSFEEGYVPSLDDLRGSGGIKQLANSVFAVSRNQQHDNPIARNTSHLTVLKCRFTGRTGPADFVLYEEETGRLIAGEDPEFLDKFEDTPAGEDDLPF